MFRQARSQVTTGAVNTKIGNERLDITELGTKAAFDTKATDIENKKIDTICFIITSEFNRLSRKNAFVQELKR